MKTFFKVSSVVFLLNCLTGCCYYGGYCDPVTGCYNSGYWAPQCGGPLDPFCFTCNGYPQWNTYGQCVDTSVVAPAAPMGCAATAPYATGDCCEGTYPTYQNGYETYPMMNQQPMMTVPNGTEMVPSYPNGGPTPVPDQGVPEPAEPEKPAAYYSPSNHQMTEHHQVKHVAANRIKEARKTQWIPVSF